MATKKHSFSKPGDFIIDKIFKEYGSKSFYKKFKDSGYSFGKATSDEWRKYYMDASIGVVSQNEFFTKIVNWREDFNKEFPGIDISYDEVIAHILPICAPTFFEQLLNTNSETNEQV